MKMPDLPSLGWKAYVWAVAAAWLAVPVLLCAILGPVAWSSWKYGPETFKAIHDASKQIPSDVHQMTTGLTSDSATIALDVHRDVVVAGGAEAETEKTMRLIRSEAPAFIAQGHQELSALHDLTVDSQTTLEEADKAIDAYEGIPAHVNPLLDSAKDATDNLAEDEHTFNTFMAGPATLIVQDSRNFLNGPLTFATSNAGELEDTVNLTVDQGRKKWVAPCSGKHCKLRAFGNTALSVVGVGATVVRDAK